MRLRLKGSFLIITKNLKHNFSESESDSEITDSDEDVMLAREILAGKSSLYREQEVNEIPQSLPAMGRSNEQISVGIKQKEDSIGSKIIETQSKRIYRRCIDTLGDVNFKLAYK